MKSLKYMELSQALIEKIKSHFPTKKYKSQAHLFYEGQIPISGFLIIDGSVQVSKKKKKKKLLQSGSLLGLKELLSKTPITMSAEVFPNTEVCFLDKTTLSEVYKMADPELLDFFLTNLEIKK